MAPKVNPLIIIYDQDRFTIPGYSLLGRMKGLAEVKGIIKSLE